MCAIVHIPTLQPACRSCQICKQVEPASVDGLAGRLRELFTASRSAEGLSKVKTGKQRAFSFNDANPKSITRAIVHNRVQACAAISNPHAKAAIHDSAALFARMMLRISTSPALSAINVSTAMRALVAVQHELRRVSSASHTEQEEYAMHIQTPAAKLIQRMRQMLPQIGVHDASSIVFCGARLQLPSDVMPSDLVTELICKVDVNETDTRSLAQTLTAMAVWNKQGRDIAANQVHSLSERFSACLTKPAVWNDHENGKLSFTVLRALANLEPPPSVAVLDVIFAHFCHATPPPSVTAARKVYSFSRVFWCCHKFHYLPSAEQAATMLSVFKGPLVALLPRQNKTHYTSNVLLAVATLGLDCSTETKQSLARMYTDNSVGDFVPNALWGMAALNILNLATFDKLLDLMVSSGNAGLPTGKVEQLQQAFYHLKPLPTAPVAEYRAWCAVDQKVASLFGRPSPRFVPCHPLYDALESLRLQCQPNAVFGMHRADAVLKLQSHDSAPLLLVLTRPSDFLINHPERLLGLTKFRYGCLARHGTLVVIPWEKCNPEYLKVKLEEATGLPLHRAFPTVPTLLKLQGRKSGSLLGWVMQNAAKVRQSVGLGNWKVW